MDENMIKLRDAFREMADMIDEMIELAKKQEEGQDVKKEIESVTGRYLLKAIELQGLSD